jgi:EAL domain-containing protein (putative c-di-GMP-specific phosphodiesterase class I)
MRDPWFAEKLLKMLVEANFPPSRFEIEITENCLHENVADARSLVSSLKNQGIRISLDDFGTGYSSLAQLRSLPFDRIKIDRTFISNLIDSTDSAAIVDAVARLGKDLGLPVTAEGIESQEILERLLQYGDIKGQGFFYGKPLPAAATRDRLASLDLLQEQQAGGVTNSDDAEALTPRPKAVGER